MDNDDDDINIIVYEYSVPRYGLAGTCWLLSVLVMVFWNSGLHSVSYLLEYQTPLNCISLCLKKDPPVELLMNKII